VKRSGVGRRDILALLPLNGSGKNATHLLKKTPEKKGSAKQIVARIRLRRFIWKALHDILLMET